MDCQYGAIEENIALLALFNPKLEPLTQQKLPLECGDSKNTARRTLTFKHEKLAAEAFSILFANTDSPNEVGAVCVEENFDRSGLILRTATNSGSQTAQINGLRSIVQSLKICSTSVNHSHGIEQFMEDVVTISQTRLLGRLRSRHALASRKSRKAPILPKLQQAVEIIAKTRPHPPQYRLFREHAEPLVEAFSRLEHLATPQARSWQGRNLLTEIIKAIGIMVETVDLKSVFSPIPRNIDSWSGDARDNLVERLQRLAQYRSAAHHLMSSARKYPVYRNIQVQGVCLSTNEPKRRPRELLPDLPGLFSRHMTEEEIVPRRLFERMLETHTGKDATSVRRAILMHAQQEKRVHAEIQLLFYYEQHPEIDIPPRIICSSKYACFLCNLFIKAHGRFYVPGSHGRIYSRWRTPGLQSLSLSGDNRERLSMCLSTFNEDLERKIREFLERQPLVLPDPNESIIFQRASKSPSLLSAATERDFPERKDELQVFESPYKSAFGRKSEIDCGSNSESLVTKASAKDIPSVSSDISSTQAGLYTEDQPCQLYLGTPASVVLSSGSSVRFHSRLIHVEFTYDDARSLVSDVSSTSSTVDTFQNNLVVYAELVDGHSQRAAGTTFDLSMKWTELDVLSSVLFGEAGMALRKRNELLLLRVLSQGQSCNEVSDTKG